MAISLLKTRTRQIGTGAWQSVEEYSCPNSQLVGEAATLWARTPAGPWSTQAAPVAVDVGYEKNAYRVGGGTVPSGRIVAVYRTLTVDEYMERVTNKGVVLVKSLARGEQIVTDRDDNIIQGIDPTDITGRTVWKIVEGSSLAAKPQTVFTVHACVRSKSMYIDAFTSFLGYTNSTFMTQLGKWGAGKRELLLVQIGAQPTRYKKSHYWVDYAFLWTGERGKTWDTITLARKFERKAVQIPQLDTDGVEVTGGEKVVHTLVPTEDTREARVYTSENFDRINRLCLW